MAKWLNHAIEVLFIARTLICLNYSRKQKSGPYRDLIFTDILRKDPAKCDIFNSSWEEGGYFCGRKSTI